MFKRISWDWVMSPLLTASLLAPQVAFAGQGGQAGNNSGNTGATGGANTSIGIPPSRGDAGFTSGGSSTAGSNTVFSIPVTLFQSGNVISALANQGVVVTTTDGGILVILPTALQAALNGIGQVLIVDLSQGTQNQQILAALLNAGAGQAIVNSLQGEVPGGIVLTTTAGGSSSTDTFATFQEVFNAISLSVGTPGTTFSIQVGDVTVTLN